MADDAVRACTRGTRLPNAVVSAGLVAVMLIMVAVELQADVTYTVGDTMAYATIQGAIDAIPAELSGTGVHTVVLHPNAVSAPYTYAEDVVVERFTGASPGDRIVVTVSGSARHTGTAGTGVHIDGSVTVATDYTTIEWLEITGPSSPILRCSGNEDTLRHCIVHDDGYGGDVEGEGEMVRYAPPAQGRLFMHSCVLYDSYRVGMRVMGASARADIVNVTIYGAHEGNQYGLEVRDTAEAHCTNVLITGCYQAFHTFDNGSLTGAYTLSDDASAPGSSSLTNRDTDQFADMAGRDLRLSLSSAAVDAGTTSPGATYDCMGVPRSLGAATDIGAFERVQDINELMQTWYQQGGTNAVWLQEGLYDGGKIKVKGFVRIKYAQ